MKKTYITFSYGYENDELTKILKKSINEFSEYDLKIYTPADFSFDYEYDNPQFWKSGYGFIMKIHSCLKSLTEFDEVVWLDTDIVATEKIDKIWEYQTELEDYPLLTKSRFANYKNNPTKQDPNLLLSHIKNLCDYFDVKNYDVNELVYLQACAMLFDKKSTTFFETVLEYFSNFDSPRLPNGDESIINGLLWKDKKNKNLGNIFLCSYFFHGNLSKVIEINDKESYLGLFDLEILENNFDKLLFFHGTKSLGVADKLFSLLVKYKKDKKKSLGEILKKNGSDKSTKHNYSELYSIILDRFLEKEINIFELGIGSNDTSIPWNMTSEGKPGASLLSWLEYFPNSNVYAADIDPKALINTDKISSFECNQLDALSIRNLWSNEKLKNLEFDIMILDGVHTFDGNMFFLNHSIHKLKRGGVCVIEDIHEFHLDSYREKLKELQYWLPTFEISLLDLHKSNEKVSDNSLMVLYKK
jgi:hypothetical protein